MDVGEKVVQAIEADVEALGAAARGRARTVALVQPTGWVVLLHADGATRSGSLEQLD